jgi:hypothetical protein
MTQDQAIAAMSTALDEYLAGKHGYCAGPVSDKSIATLDIMRRKLETLEARCLLFRQMEGEVPRSWRSRIAEEAKDELELRRN